jgi:hypothetical protein
MRAILFTVAAAASALALSAPASAQWYPPQSGYGYNYGHVRNLQVRIDRIQRDLAHLARYRIITRGEYSNRRQESRSIERRLRRDARDGRGLTRSELYSIERRIARLEHRIARDVRDGRRWRYRW